MRKLVNTLNKACEKDRLSPERLNKAFEVWYPTLEQELSKLKGKSNKENDKPEAVIRSIQSQEILEEILDLTRNNQKLIRNPEGVLTNQIEETRHMVREILERQQRIDGPVNARSMKRFYPRLVNELMHFTELDFGNGSTGIYMGVQMLLATVRDEFPWIYENGMETLKIIKSKCAQKEKEKAIELFSRIVEFTFGHPLLREKMERSKEWHILSRELPHALNRSMQSALVGSL